MKNPIKTDRVMITPEDSAEIEGGFLLPSFFIFRMTVAAIELGNKIIDWLTTEH